MPKVLKGDGGGEAFSANLERRESVVIGRGLDCDIVIRDVKASRRHCKLTRQAGSFLLEDLNSKNGTYVDGVRIKDPILLNMNQTFKIGDTMFYLAP